MSAIVKVYKLINKFSRQVPDSHHGDSHKVEFLHSETVDSYSSNEPSSRVATYDLSLNMLYGEL